MMSRLTPLAVCRVGLGIAALGLIMDKWLRARWEPAGTWPWIVFAVVGVALAAALSRANRRSLEPDLDAEWRVYCHLVRPLILAQRPGLLDWNNPADGSSAARLDVRLRTIAAMMLRDRGVDLWGPCAAGWCAGLAAIAIWRAAEAVPIWAFSFPLAGLVAGPLFSVFWRYAAFRKVERMALDHRR